MARHNLGALALLLAFAWLFAPVAAHAAESYDNCTGFITSLPTVITTQGTWCLGKDLATAITSGKAITISTNNVTIDCNDFKIGGLAAGAGTLAEGIWASNRLNATVRHCNIRGFFYGVHISGTGGGHAVEDNRFDGNTNTGVSVAGDGSVIRRNLVFDTGGATFTDNAYGITASDSVDLLDNTVSGVLATAGSNGSAFGIYTANSLDGQIAGNRVRGLVKDGFGTGYGIVNAGNDRITLRSNDIVGDGTSGGFGLQCSVTGFASAKDNVVNKFATGLFHCLDDGGNVVRP